METHGRMVSTIPTEIYYIVFIYWWSNICGIYVLNISFALKGFQDVWQSLKLTLFLYREIKNRSNVTNFNHENCKFFDKRGICFSRF